MCTLNGVRQGGVLSPLLCNIYVDCIINTLENFGLGCHFINCYIWYIMYAGDLLLIWLSVLDLPRMLDFYRIEGNYLGINCNSKKSYSIGSRQFANLSTLYWPGMALDWVEKITYLSVCIFGGTSFKVDTSTTRCNSFYHPLTEFVVNVLKLQILAKLFVKLIISIY